MPSSNAKPRSGDGPGTCAVTALPSRADTIASDMEKEVRPVGLFQRVEQKLERAVNGAFARAFRSEVQPVELASAIRRAMDDRAAVLGRGRTIVPNMFTIELSDTDYDRLHDYEDDLEIELIAAAEEHAESQRYQPAGPVRVGFEAAEDLETGVFRVRPSTARHPDQGGRPAPARERRAPARQDWDDGYHDDEQDPLDPRGAPDEAPAAAGPFTAVEAAAPRPPLPRINPADRPWLDVDGERYPLMGPMTVLGRDETADIVLDDPGISRRHCEVRVTTDGPHLVASLRDLQSTNGTYVNGERVTSTRLHEADSVTVGRTTVTFRAGRR